MNISTEDRYSRDLSIIKSLVSELPESLDSSQDLSKILSLTEDIENAGDRLRYAIEKFIDEIKESSQPTPEPKPIPPVDTGNNLPIFDGLPVTHVNNPEEVTASLQFLYDNGGGTLVIPDKFPLNVNTKTVARGNNDWEGRHLRVVGSTFLQDGSLTNVIDPGLNLPAINFNSNGGTLVVEGIQINGWENEVLTNSGRWQRLVIKDCEIIGGRRSLGIWEAKLPVDRRLREIWIVNTRFGSSTGSHCIYIHGRDIAAYVINSEFGNAPRGKEALKCISGLAIIVGNRMLDRFDVNPGPGQPPMKRIQCAFSLIKDNKITIHRDGVAQDAIHIGTGRRSAHGCWLPPYGPFRPGGTNMIYEIPDDQTRGFGADDRFWDALENVDLEDPLNPYAFRHYVTGNIFEFIGDPQLSRKNLLNLLDTLPKQTKDLGFEVPRARDRAHAFWYDNNTITGHGLNPGDKKLVGNPAHLHLVIGDTQPDLPILPGEVPWAHADQNGDVFGRLFLPSDVLALAGQRSPIAVVPDWLPEGAAFNPTFA